MRVLAILFGVGTAVGIAAGVSAAPAESGIQLAQAQDSARRQGPVQAQASAAAPVTAKVARRGHGRFAGARRGDAPVRRWLGQGAERYQSN